jgi:hypothetical protein
MFVNGISESTNNRYGVPTTGARKTDIPPPARPNTTFECLDVWSNEETTLNAPLDAYACDSTMGQWFYFNTLHELQTVDSTCVTAISSAQGANVEIEKCSDSVYQQWVIDETTPELHNVGSGSCMDVVKESPLAGASVIVNPCTFSGSSPAGQAWDLNLIWPTLQIPSPTTWGIPTASLLALNDAAENTGYAPGSWIDTSAQAAGDFDGDGHQDIAYISSVGGELNFDVYLYSMNYEVPQRWATNSGGWINGGTFLGGDFDGDGFSDIAYAFDIGNGELQIDVHLSTGSRANGGFLTPYRWGYNQGGDVTPNQWLAGDFNGDGRTDLAYVFSSDGYNSDAQINLDVHQSIGTHSTESNGFSLVRWNTGQGNWINVTPSDPQQPQFGHPDAYWGKCSQCARAGQWVTGDFNGDHLTDLGLAYQNTSNNINLDVHLSTGSSTQGFDLQNASLNQGGWATEGWWVAADMDDDGLDDMVSVFGDGSGGDLNVDVHSSRVQGFSVGNAAGFVLQRYSSLIANRFYTPSNDSVGCLGGTTTPNIMGDIFAGNFSHQTGSHFNDIAIVYPNSYFSCSNSDDNYQFMDVALLY